MIIFGLFPEISLDTVTSHSARQCALLPDDQKALICAVFSAPNRLHSCLLSPYSAGHSSDIAGAKAVGWLPLSDGKLLLMCCWVGCQVLALLVRGGGGGGEG